MPKTHDLKTLPEHFSAVASGVKTFEIRCSDRGFDIGDVLYLREWTEDGYTGRAEYRRVTYMTTFAQREGYVVLGMVPV